MLSFPVLFSWVDRFFTKIMSSKNNGNYDYVLRMHNKGTHVVIADVSRELGQQVESDLLEQKYSTLVIPTDVSKENKILSI